MTLSASIQAAWDFTSTLHGWTLNPPEQTKILDTAFYYATRDQITTFDDLAAMIFNMYHDYHLVEAALDHDHSDYNTVWEYIHKEILDFLYRRNIYPQDPLMLNEFSPDVCAYEDLKCKLHQFHFNSSLRHYIHIVTFNAVREWFRSRGALKRGGSGTTSACERRMTPRPLERWRTCYLSQSLGSDSHLCWEDIVSNDVGSPATLAEEHLLIEVVETVIKGMVNDPQYELISSLWQDLLFDNPNITQLASSLNLHSKVLFNLKNRIARRVAPALRHWQGK